MHFGHIILHELFRGTHHVYMTTYKHDNSKPNPITQVQDKCKQAMTTHYMVSHREGNNRNIGVLFVRPKNTAHTHLTLLTLQP